MKKKLLIGLGIFFSLIAVAASAAVIYFWPMISGFDFSIVNWSNVKALYVGLTEAPEVTDEKMKQIDEKRVEEIKDYISMDIRDFTEEELKQIESGEKTKTAILAQIIAENVENQPDENIDTEDVAVNNGDENNSAVDQSGGNKTDNKVNANESDKNQTTGDKTITNKNNTESNKPQNSGDKVNNTETGKTQTTDKKPVESQKDKVEANQSKPTTSSKPSSNKKTETADEIVARHIAALHKLQGNFESRVSALASNAKNWVKAYYNANKANKVTWRDAKIAGVQHFSSTASQIESDCYAQVDAQIEKLRADLKAIGADTSIVNSIRESAYAEMDAKKAKIVQMGNAKLNKK